MCEYIFNVTGIQYKGPYNKARKFLPLHMAAVKRHWQQLLKFNLAQITFSHTFNNNNNNISEYYCHYIFFQNIDVTKQADVDKIMLDLDGTENKCKCKYPINSNNVLTALFVLFATLET